MVVWAIFSYLVLLFWASFGMTLSIKMSDNGVLYGGRYVACVFS